jgi:hypothetical protein
LFVGVQATVSVKVCAAAASIVRSAVQVVPFVLYSATTRSEPATRPVPDQSYCTSMLVAPVTVADRWIDSLAATVAAVSWNWIRLLAMRMSPVVATPSSPVSVHAVSQLTVPLLPVKDPLTAKVSPTVSVVCTRPVGRPPVIST